MVQCRTCGGSYEPALPDGTQYFHACPPLSVVELTAAVAAGLVVLPAGETPAQAIALRTYTRANARNENLASTDAKNAGAVVAAGLGAPFPMAAPPPPVVVVPVVPPPPPPPPAPLV